MKQKFKDILSKVLVFIAKAPLGLAKVCTKLADKLVAAAEKLGQ